MDSQVDLYLPENIKKVTFRGSEIKSISSNIKALKILGLKNYNWSVIKQLNQLETLEIYSALDTMVIKQFNASDLPLSITDLYITSYKYPIVKGTFPNGLKKLDLTCANCDTLIEPGSLPESITKLRISVPKSIPFYSNYFPNNLLKLDLSKNSLDYLPDDFKLPNTITSLKLICSNLKSSFKFPQNLKSLQLNTTQLKENKGPFLPESLEKLTLITSEQHPATAKILPRSLVKLRINCSVLLDSNGTPILSNSIKHLVLTPILYKRKDTLSGFKVLPNSLPNSLTYLCLDDIWGPHSSYSLENEDLLPSTLTHLDFGEKFNQPMKLTKLVNLKTLYFGRGFDSKLDIGSNLTNLELLTISNRYYNHPIIVPSKSTKVLFDSYYKQFSNFPLALYSLSITSALSLREISLHDKSNLEYLDCGNYFFGPICKEDLPINNNIKVLKLGSKYSRELNLDYFPSLEVLELTQLSNPTLISTTNHKNLKSIIVPYCNINFLDNVVGTVFQKYLNIINNNKQFKI